MKIMRTKHCLIAGLVLLAVLSATSLFAATINITTYGANGSDTSDDRAAIQNAINASTAGDTVYFPNGTYYISGQLAPKSGIKLIGQSQSGAVIRFNASTEQKIITMENLTGVEIAHLTLDGNNNGNAQVGVYAYRGSGHNLHHLTIRNLTAANMYGPFGIQFNGSAGIGTTDSVISDNTITNIGPASTWGGGIRMSWGSSRNKILRNNITWTGRGGIFGNDGSTDLVIQNNTVAHSGKTSEGLGIEVWGGCHRAIIEDNIIDHWLSLDASSGCAVRRNIVRDVAESRISWAGLELVASSDVVFTDNTVDHGALIGISLSNDPAKNHCYWGYNTIQYCAMWGAQFQGDANGARHHYLYKNKFLNTVKNHPSAPYAGGFGFRFNGNAYQITLDANEIKDNQDLGIQFSGGIDQISVVNNLITGNASSAASGYPSTAADLEWANNTVTGNGNNTQPTSRGFGNQKPNANFNAPSSAAVGQAVTFSNTSSDPDGTISHFLWDFNDGLPSTSSSPIYTFNKAGTYRVTLIVWDNGGRGARVEKIIVIGSGGSSGSKLLELQFNEGSGTPVDTGGQNNTIQNNGATWTSAGHTGSAMDFLNGGVNATGPIQSALNGAFTLEAWVKLRSFPAWRNGIFGHEVYAASGFRFGIDAGGKLVFWTSESGGNINAVSTTSIALNTWAHVRAAYSAGTVDLFINGNPVGTASGTYIPSSATFQVGRFNGSPAFDGFIDEAIVSAGIGNGLAGSYYNSTGLSGPVVINRTEAVDFDWGSGSPAAGINVDGFSVRWTGQLAPPVSGSYTFRTVSDDGVRLWVNGSQVINNWTDHAPTANDSSPISLTGGNKYNIVMEYYENGGGAVARLQWKTPGSSSFVAIPSGNLLDALPSPWAALDIGGPGVEGSESFNSVNSNWDINGGGTDIWGASDQFHFASQDASGDCEIKARVTFQENTDVWAKAGVMIRETTAGGSKHAFMAITPGNGFAFQRRPTTSAQSESTAGGTLNAAPNNWVRLVRSGSTITAYKSANGSSWTSIGSVSISMSASVKIGLAVTAHNNTTLSTARFDNVTAIP